MNKIILVIIAITGAITGITVCNEVFGVSSSHLSPLSAYMNNSSNPNWNKSMHINTTAEIEKSMADAVNWVKTHNNTNTSSPSFKLNITKVTTQRLGSDIDIPINIYNQSKINQK